MRAGELSHDRASDFPPRIVHVQTPFHSFSRTLEAVLLGPVNDVVLHVPAQLGEKGIADYKRKGGDLRGTPWENE